MIWTGGDAPNREAMLTASLQEDGMAVFYEPGYCGCEDCHWIVGRGDTLQEAIADYWEQWQGEYGA